VTTLQDERIRQLLLQMVQAMVEAPDSVNVEERIESDSTTFLVRVAPSDIGYVIGKDGRVANAVRTVVKEAAKRSGMKLYLDVKGYSEAPDE
jgi:predicted RNA-binding protein YlqC (UPF0109 family)